MLVARLREDPAWIEARRHWQRAYYLAHHDELKRIQRERNRSRYARDREGVRAEQHRWRTEHLERTRLSTRLSYHRRRLRAGAAVIKADDWLQLLERYGGRCGYCGTEGPLEMEHRVPIARGGTHALSNLIPACRRCNRRKGTKTEEEFRRSLAARAIG